MTIRAHLGWWTALIAVAALTSVVWSQSADPSRGGTGAVGTRRPSAGATNTPAGTEGRPRSGSLAGMQTQSGLPPELFIPNRPSLDEQRRRLENLLAVQGLVGGESQGGRRGGLLEGLKSLFTGGPQVVVVDVPALAASADSLRTTQVEVHGVLKQSGGKLYFAGQQTDYEVDLAGGVKPEGFPEGALDWMPAVAKGLVELPFGRPVVHATSLTPSAPMALLRLARVLEIEGQTREALETYQKAATELQRARLSWAAFAACHAGWLAYAELRDPKLARHLLDSAWMLYAVQNHGRPGFDVWTPRPDGQGWVRQDVATAIGPLLDMVGRESFWYRLVDFFVTAAGGSAAIGVILLALVTRIVLHPLTLKQMWSAEEMRRLQPQIKALQEEFKDDKQRFQQEMWRLWQEHGVNPFGGCWPMLIQMPILIFVYQGIRGYIVRFSQSQFLWVRNMAL
ncbi:MAG: YidC/Oxa1 family membrane protein insertase, partial [Armatimonadetes bacterium]|nr:YidC/Oxa1 family membrane protein insertase [Armatimonadota bacterium]